MSDPILDDWICGSEHGNILIIRNLEDRYTIATSRIHHRAMSSNKALILEYI